LSFNCIHCSTKILQSNRIKEWKDLPSENWADLMDFWHCHKPDVHHEEDERENGKTRGYSRLGYAVAQKSVGLVDMMYFLLDKHDVQNLEEVSLHSFVWSYSIIPLCTNALVLYKTRVFKNTNHALKTLFSFSLLKRSTCLLTEAIMDRKKVMEYIIYTLSTDTKTLEQ